MKNTQTQTTLVKSPLTISNTHNLPLMQRLTTRLIAEFIGTLFLLTTVVGSGIMASNLAMDNDAVALLGNAVATGVMLVVLITVIGPISQAHFNPAVSLAMLICGKIERMPCFLFMLSQIAGGLCGMWLAHVMFDMEVIQISERERTGLGQWVAEIVATFGLVATIFGTLKAKPALVPTMVGLYITGAYFFTASTSFANPAVTVARSFTDTFSGISPGDMPAFIVAQLIGALLAALLWMVYDKLEPNATNE